MFKRKTTQAKGVLLSFLIAVFFFVIVHALSASDDPTWAYLRSKKIENSKPLTLAELVDIALRNNPSTRQIWQNVRANEYIKKQAQSSLYPQATLSAAVNREKTNSNQAIYDVNELNYGPSFQITYLLLDFGGRGATIEEASQNIVAANFQLNQAIQDLLLSVETAYYNLHSAYSNLNAAKSDLANARKVFYSAQQRFDVGLASKLDVLQAKATYDDVRYSLENAKAAVKNAKASLAQTIGVPADTAFEISQPSRQIPTQVKEKDVVRLIEEAIERRPDIKQAQALLKVKEAAIKSANSNLWPTLNLGGSAQGNRYNYYGVKKENESDHAYAGSATINWDIFDGFYNLNKKRQAEVEAAAEYDKLIETELQVSADVWSKYYDFTAAVSKLRFSRSFLHTAGASFELALESYNTGLKSILDLLDAQSKLSDAKSQLIQSEKDVFVTLAELTHSTGSLYTKEIRQYD